MATTVGTKLPKKLPDEEVYVDFDFANLFASGVTINTPTFTARIGAADGALTTDLVPVTLPPTISSLVASQLVKGGVAGTTYLIEMHVKGSDNSSQSIQLLLPVVAQRLG